LNNFCPAVILLLISHTGFSENEMQRRTSFQTEMCFWMRRTVAWCDVASDYKSGELWIRGAREGETN